MHLALALLAISAPSVSHALALNKGGVRACSNTAAEVVVVGAGPGGCAAALRLVSEGYAKSVTLLERGKPLQKRQQERPDLSLGTVALQPSWLLDPYIGDKVWVKNPGAYGIPEIFSSGTGGNYVINGGLWMLQEELLKAGFSHLIPYAKNLTAAMQPAVPDPNDPGWAEHRAAARKAWPESEYYLWVNPMITRDPLLNKSSERFLPQDLLYESGVNGVKVVEETLADVVLFDSEGLATGVRDANGCIHSASTNKVILAAGFAHSVALLHRSGVGPAQVLNDLGIKGGYVNEDVGKGVFGQAYIIYLAYLPFWKLPDPMAQRENAYTVVSKDLKFSAYLYQFKPSAVLAGYVGASVGGFLGSLLPGTFFMVTGGQGNDTNQDGSVRAVSSDPATPPEITFNLFDTSDDAAISRIEALRLGGLKIWDYIESLTSFYVSLTSNFHNFFGNPFPKRLMQDFDTFLARIMPGTMSGFHTSGGLHGAVNADFSVKGVSGVYPVDASTLPSQYGASNGAVVMCHASYVVDGMYKR